MSRGTVRPSSICADCTAPDPTWASINRGVLLCDECCSVHRSLGRHISQVKHLRRGQWNAARHAMVYQLANNGANNIWEHSLLDPSQNKHGRRKPSPRDPLHPTKADFIRAKYQFLSFVNKQKDSDASSIEDVSKELHSSVRTNNVETCLRLLSKGADPNYFNKEKGNCPIHVAAQAGQPSQVELLVVYGADPGALDANGKTPMDYARVEGFLDLADRLVELQFELTDRLAYHVCNRFPDHRNRQHFIIPEMGDGSSEISELAKQAKKKLQALSNHLFEELAMDVYDEVDRRENDSAWMATHDNATLVSDRQTVPFLPVNPDLSTTRNQGRQKLARFNVREFATLIIDILSDAKRRQLGITSPIATPRDPDYNMRTVSAISDDEPLYDVVASDEDYSSIDSQSIKSMRDELKRDRPAEDEVSTGRVTPPVELEAEVEAEVEEEEEEATEPMQDPGREQVSREQFVQVKRELAAYKAKCEQLSGEHMTLVQKLQHVQGQMENLRKENMKLKEMKKDDFDDLLPNGVGARDSDACSEESIQLRLIKSTRPQSMFEPRDQQRQSLGSQGREDQMQSASSLANIHRMGGNQLSLVKESRDPHEVDRMNANLPDPDYDLPVEPAGKMEAIAEASDHSSMALSDSASSCSLGGLRAPPTATATAMAFSEGSEGEAEELPTQEEVVRKTEKITRKIQELLHSAQEGKIESFGACSEKIHAATSDMAALFPKRISSESIREALHQLTTSAALLLEECRDYSPPPPPDPAGEAERPPSLQSAPPVITYAFDIAKAAKQLVTLFQ